MASSPVNGGGKMVASHRPQYLGVLPRNWTREPTASLEQPVCRPLIPNPKFIANTLAIITDPKPAIRGRAKREAQFTIPCAGVPGKDARNGYRFIAIRKKFSSVSSPTVIAELASRATSKGKVKNRATLRNTGIDKESRAVESHGRREEAEAEAEGEGGEKGETEEEEEENKRRGRF